MDAWTLAVTVEKLGAGKILLCGMKLDSTNSGYDLELTKLVKEAVTIPVIASSGADKVAFSMVFMATEADAALTTGIFHYKEVPIAAVKEYLRKSGIKVR